MKISSKNPSTLQSHVMRNNFLGVITCCKQKSRFYGVALILVLHCQLLKTCKAITLQYNNSYEQIFEVKREWNVLKINDIVRWTPLCFSSNI